MVRPDDRLLIDWRDQAHPAHSALVIVDMQNDFVHPDGWVATQQVPGFLADTGINGALDQTARLLSAARAVDLPVVHVRMIGDDRYLGAPLAALYQRNHGHQRPVCVQEGTWGADFYGDLRPDGRPVEMVLDKHRYSAFIGTRLAQWLRSNGVCTVVVCGVATSGCVESTIRDAFMLDHYVVTVGDACADYEQARHDATLAKMHLSFGTVVTTDDVVECWKNASR